MLNMNGYFVSGQLVVINSTWLNEVIDSDIKENNRRKHSP